MERSTNALAELAERLNQVGVELIYDKLDADSKDAIRKAKRIVAELAAISDDDYGRPMISESVNAVRICRAIAEEGAEGVEDGNR